MAGSACTVRRGTSFLLAFTVLLFAVTTTGGQAPKTDTLTLRIIVVESQEDARMVQTRLARGEDFADLARTLSVDPSSRDGGMIGTVGISTLRPELQDVLQNVGIGHLSPITRVPLGFAILEVVSDTDVLTDSPSNAGLMGLTAEGSVKYVIDVAGFGAAAVAARLFSSPEVWNRNPQAACEQRTQVVDTAIATLRKDFASPSAQQIADAGHAVVQGLAMLGQFHVYRGEMDEAIREYQRAYDLAGQHDPKSLLNLEEVLGIAYLHRAEMANGIYHEPGDRCLLNHDGLPAFAKTMDVQKAIEHFSRYLAERPDELEVRWLLNLAHMATGGYPQKVPREHLVPMYQFTAGGDVGRFQDVAVRSGVSSFAAAGGVVVDDFDGDSHLDIMTSSLEPCGPLRFFRNNGNGTFSDRAPVAGLGDQLGGLNIVQADYNNDGHLDLLVLRGGWELPQQKSLLRNNGDGTFSDVTEASGLGGRVTATQTAVWADIDQDGFLDLFIGNENSAAQLFRNKRNGTFEDIARAAGVARTSFAKGVTAGDYDGDGWMDLYVSNSGGVNFLYRNKRDGTFIETGRTAGVPGPGLGFATWFFDYDNDGWQDLFVTSYFLSVDETARTYLGLPNNAGTLRLYRNLGNGRFQDVTRRTGLNKVFMPMGANFGDIDNDGYLDIYLGTGNPSYASILPSVLLRN
ncbi:MAG TPA: FG-GAP-like repeat-containing protein, partial [Vicinamibacterales bacterium]|nr:FG-GAP-like repeat-containing protein [Vicinamibacterales bacterium]